MTNFNTFTMTRSKKTMVQYIPLEIEKQKL